MRSRSVGPSGRLVPLSPRRVVSPAPRVVPRSRVGPTSVFVVLTTGLVVVLLSVDLVRALSVVSSVSLLIRSVVLDGPPPRVVSRPLKRVVDRVRAVFGLVTSVTRVGPLSVSPPVARDVRSFRVRCCTDVVDDESLPRVGLSVEVVSLSVATRRVVVSVVAIVRVCCAVLPRPLGLVDVVSLPPPPRSVVIGGRVFCLPVWSAVLRTGGRSSAVVPRPPPRPVVELVVSPRPPRSVVSPSPPRLVVRPFPVLRGDSVDVDVVGRSVSRPLLSVV